MIRALIPLLLVACQTEAPMVSGVPADMDSLPTEQAAPPAFSLSAPDYAFPGQSITLVASGLPAAGISIRFAGSRVTGGAPFCPAAFGGCFDLSSPALILGTRNTVAGGSAPLTLTLPAGISAGPVYTQAGTRRAASTYLSTIETIQVLDRGGDYDGDGLTNSDEDSLGTNPLIRDTDSGGESDGSEVARGADPLDPADDVAPAGCFIDFEASYLSSGQGGNPTTYYGGFGLTFLMDSGYGLIGGDQYGDPDNWSDGTTVTTPAWGNWDFGNEVSRLVFSAPTAGAQFDVIRTEGGTTVDVQVTASLAGALVSQSIVTSTLRTTATVSGRFDTLAFTIVGGDGFAYAIDDITYGGIGFGCP